MFNAGFHTLAFWTAALPFPSTNVALGTVNDQIIPVTNNQYLLPQDMVALVGYLGTDTPTALRLNMPSLLVPTLPYFDPLSGTLLPANVPPLIRMGDAGLPMEGAENISLEASRGGAANQDTAALLWIAPRAPSKAVGSIRTIRATSTITQVAGSWVNGSLTFTSTLQAGTYQIVGLSAYGTSLLAARFVFSNQILRPGTLAQGAQGEWNDETFRHGNLGVWGTFTNTTIPTMDVFGTAVAAAQTYYIDVIRVGG